MRLASLCAPLVASFALVGCVDATPEAPLLTPTDADRSTPAYQACVAAIAKTTGQRAADVNVIEYIYSEANTQVRATIPGADAPWQCLSSNSGQVAQVMFTGSEGAL